MTAMSSSGEARQAGTGDVQVRCRVDHETGGGFGSFAAEFCHALERDLARDLGRRFRLVSRWQGDGTAVMVDVRLLSNRAAKVDMAFGRTTAGSFVASSKIERRIGSFDRPLQPASARTLVLDIGKGLGLVK
jgi:hypothetical protein